MRGFELSLQAFWDGQVFKLISNGILFRIRNVNVMCYLRCMLCIRHFQENIETVFLSDLGLEVLSHRSFLGLYSPKDLVGDPVSGESMISSPALFILLSLHLLNDFPDLVFFNIFSWSRFDT